MGINSRIFEEIRELESHVIEGEILPIEAYIELKQLSEIVDLTIKNINEMVIGQVSKEPEKVGLNHSGYIAKVQQKTTWKFDHIKKWVIAKEGLKSVEEQAKKAAILSAQLNPNMGFDSGDVLPGIVNEQTGEMIEPAVSIKSAPFIKLEKIKNG